MSLSPQVLLHSRRNLRCNHTILMLYKQSQRAPTNLYLASAPVAALIMLRLFFSAPLPSNFPFLVSLSLFLSRLQSDRHRCAAGTGGASQDTPPPLLLRQGSKRSAPSAPREQEERLPPLLLRQLSKGSVPATPSPLTARRGSKGSALIVPSTLLPRCRNSPLPLSLSPPLPPPHPAPSATP